MKVRTTALVLALALSVSLLSACGGKDNADQSAASTPSASVSTPAQSTPDASAPAVSTPDVSAPAEQPVPLPEPIATLALNKSDFTLFNAGETYTLEVEVTGLEEALVWTSSDESVATVREDGVVTAVSPGTATITVACGDMTVDCVVRCDWVAEEQPAPDTSAPSTSAPEAPIPSVGHVDLDSFYNDIMASGGENAPAMMEVTGEYLDSFYPGLAQVSMNQCVVYTPMISAVACEVAMVECANVADVETVKAILQARVDNQVAGGAWYPDTIAGWQNNAKIVVKGNYVALFVIPEGLMDAATEFGNRF